MARIRSLKPDAFKSESLSRVPRGTRWTFAGLWTYVDDAGRGKDNARLIWAALYPLDPEIEVDDVEHDLTLLVRIGAVIRYVADGARYLAIPAFDKHQAAAYRRSESHLPPPSPQDLALFCTQAHEESCNPDSLESQEESEVGPDLHFSARKGVQESAGREGKGVRRGKGRESSADAAEAPKSSTSLAVIDRPDVERICTHLADRIEANGAKRPEIGKTWHDAARLLIDRDGRSEQDIHAAIDWCQTDSFWRANVLSMPKLREKYETLRLQAQRPGAATTVRRGDIDWEAAAQRAADRDAREAK